MMDVTEDRCEQPERAGKSAGKLFSSGFDKEPKRASLRERCEYAQRQAHVNANKERRMMELGALLDKNPEVARILDLIEEVGQ